MCCSKFSIWFCFVIVIGITLLKVKRRETVEVEVDIYRILFENKVRRHRDLRLELVNFFGDKIRVTEMID